MQQGSMIHVSLVKIANSCLAYFNGSLDTVFGVVNRQEFEKRLHAHFNEPPKDDSPWYALRNTVYASGCKIIFARQTQPCTFADAQKQAWKYFENALSVHTELIYMHSDLLAIEALMAMVCHCGIGRQFSIRVLIDSHIGFLHRGTWQSSSRVHVGLKRISLGLVQGIA